MTNGLKHDATVGYDTIALGGDNVTTTTRATTHPDNQMTPEHLIHDLLERAAVQDTLKVSEQPADQDDDQLAKPARSLVDRLVATPIRNVATWLVLAKVAVMTYQPAPRHVALLLMVTILLIVPWMLPSLGAIVLGTVAFVYLVIGHDNSIRLVATWFNWLKRRDSHGAEVVRARAERVSNRLTGWLTRLPNNWTNGLYLPDFAVVDDYSDKLKSDPFGRLAGAAQNR